MSAMTKMTEMIDFTAPTHPADPDETCTPVLEADQIQIAAAYGVIQRASYQISTDARTGTGAGAGAALLRLRRVAAGSADLQSLRASDVAVAVAAVGRLQQAGDAEVQRAALVVQADLMSQIATVTV